MTRLMLVASYMVCLFPAADSSGWGALTGQTELQTSWRGRGEYEGTVDSTTKISEADAMPHFSVSKVRITGNTILSTTELLEKLPLVYHEYEMDPVSGKPKKDPVSGKPIIAESYDFRWLAGLIARPGSPQEVSAKAISGFTRYLLSVYEKEGYRGIFVYVPTGAFDAEGKLVNGVLPVRVLEARVAQVKVDRYTFEREKRQEGILKDSVIERWSPIKQGQVIQKRQLDDFVRLLNLNPDRHVSAVVSKADEPNLLNLTYDVYEANPWHVYVQVDDSGTKERQWAPRIGLFNRNATGIDDRLSLQYQAPWERGIEDEYAVFGMYDLPVRTPRFRLGTYGGYSEFDVTAEGISFLGNGSFFGGMLNYNVMQLAGWFIDLTSSISRESSKVTPSLGITSDVDMDLWTLGLQLYRRAESGMSDTVLALERIASIGGSSQDTFDEARSGADRDFAIYTASATHVKYLDSRRVHRLSGFFRIVDPDSRLVPAKMTVFGGLRTVKGYEEDEIVADGGVLLSGQYEFDLVKFSRPEQEDLADTISADRKKPWLRRLAPLLFADTGRAETKDPLPGEERIQELASVGIGAIVEAQDNFTGALYYGWPLRSTKDTDKGSGKLNVSLVYRF